MIISACHSESESWRQFPTNNCCCPWFVIGNSLWRTNKRYFALFTRNMMHNHCFEWSKTSWVGGRGGEKRCFIGNVKIVNKLSVVDEKLAILFYAHRIFDSKVVITLIYCFSHRQLHFQNEPNTLTRIYWNSTWLLGKNLTFAWLSSL